MEGRGDMPWERKLKNQREGLEHSNVYIAEKVLLIKLMEVKFKYLFAHQMVISLNIQVRFIYIIHA